MAGQIIFLNKNKADINDSNVTATASQNAEFAYLALNRNNYSAWVTSGSVDADNTTYTISFGEGRYIDYIRLVKMNFKNFTVKYYDGATYQNFTSPINVTNNTSATVGYRVTEVFAYGLQITITGTMTANEDKYLYQFIATTWIGQLNSWPIIKAPTHMRSRIITKMLSGKVSVLEQVGAFKMELSYVSLKDAADLTLFEYLYQLGEGFLVLPGGDNETQFNRAHIGYRKEDIYLMRIVNDYVPEFYKGLYGCGIALKVQLQEAVG